MHMRGPASIGREVSMRVVREIPRLQANSEEVAHLPQRVALGCAIPVANAVAATWICCALHRRSGLHGSLDSLHKWADLLEGHVFVLLSVQHQQLPPQTVRVRHGRCAGSSCRNPGLVDPTAHEGVVKVAHLRVSLLHCKVGDGGTSHAATEGPLLVLGSLGAETARARLRPLLGSLGAAAAQHAHQREVAAPGVSADAYTSPQIQLRVPLGHLLQIVSTSHAVLMIHNSASVPEHGVHEVDAETYGATEVGHADDVAEAGEPIQERVVIERIHRARTTVRPDQRLQRASAGPRRAEEQRVTPSCTVGNHDFLRCS
mmetsp:Transcript_42187/g.131864  ORF Transcript_42187/g.131864 Transcript_42187/m.131864 type:complete len:316 (-) Transcript_42187:259-1206(-)